MSARRLNGTWYVVPCVVFLLILTLFPFLFTIFASLRDWYLPEGLGQFVWLRNYIDILLDGEFWRAVGVSLTFAVSALLAEHLLGFLLAFGISRTMRLRGFLTVGFMLPMMLPPILVALIWRLMMNPTTGVLNYFLQAVGLPRSLWLHSPRTVVASLVLIDVWQWTPFVMLVLLGGINAIPKEFSEAMAIDGADLRSELRHLILPLLKPFFAVTILLRFVFVFTTFDVIMALTRGGPGGASTTAYLQAYLTSFAYLKMGSGGAMSILIFLITISVSTFLLRRVIGIRENRGSLGAY
ncbi:MAG: carbohydrate ABC transporter permease [Bacteroidota bacterium]